ncbi:hypothetical protein EZV62_013091 [Acer yangbiense]|uniref:YqgF/RNase H-like domain-containing protein n=1 Tax=Acer yangbiense TaxID=1000413 RepID=A0A5C7HY01_9ROSI|nr:hypothetical protein EZV62_013091 [Acer yangbiense]
MEYLKPVDFHKGIFKDILKKEDYLKPGRLLGLDVSDKYVSLAVSDWKNKTAVPLRALDRLEINMDSMADMIQSLISEHNLVGFVVGSKRARPMDAQTRTFIDNLCKTEKVQGLKYTVWEFGITSKPNIVAFLKAASFESVVIGIALRNLSCLLCAVSRVPGTAAFISL